MLALHHCTRLSPVTVIRGSSSLRSEGFLWWWLFLLWSTDSRLTGFGSCGSRT